MSEAAALKPNGYVIRLVHGKWLVLLWQDNVYTGHYIEGDDYADAQAKAKETGLPDVERNLGDRGR